MSIETNLAILKTLHNKLWGNRVKLTPKQVQWMYKNEPDTKHISNYMETTIELEFPKFDRYDYAKAKDGFSTYYLDESVYNSLPEDFKALAK